MSTNSFIQSVDDRTSLAGANKLEVLLFSLGEDTESQHQKNAKERTISGHAPL